MLNLLNKRFLKANWNFNVNAIIFKTILILIVLKLTFSYLLIKLSFFQRHFIANKDRFNFLGLPEDFSSKLEFLLFPLLVTFILLNLKYLERFNSVFLLSFVLYVINLITGLVNSVSILDSLNNSIKIFAPIYLFIVLNIQYKKDNYDLKKNMFFFIKYCFILSLIGLIFFSPSFNRLQFYLPIFFSGNHTNSYILVFCFIGLTYHLYRKQKKGLMIVVLLSSFTFLLFGYNIRTALILYLSYILMMLYLCHDLFKLLFIKALVFLLPILILGFFINSNFDLDHFSSGRLSMYQAKMDQILNNSFLEWCFGSGFNSDLIVIDTWWWDLKGAHSDILTFLIENGAIYLFFIYILVLLLLVLPKRINLIYAILIIGYLFSSTISNGLMTRPLAAYIYFIVLSYILVDISKYKKQIE